MIDPADEEADAAIISVLNKIAPAPAPPADDLCARLRACIGPDRLDPEDDDASVPRWYVEQAAARIAAQQEDITTLHDSLSGEANARIAAEARCAELDAEIERLRDENYRISELDAKSVRLQIAAEARCAELDAEIERLRAERVDWARRFKLNDVTPWEWMTRAEAAESRCAELADEVIRLRTKL